MTTHLAITFSNKSAMKMGDMSLGEFVQIRKNSFTCKTKKHFRTIQVLHHFLGFLNTHTNYFPILTLSDNSSNRISLEVKLNVHVFALKVYKRFQSKINWVCAIPSWAFSTNRKGEWLIVWNIYGLLTKSEDKTAGYWPSSFFPVEVHKLAKKNKANIQPSWPNKLGQWRIYHEYSFRGNFSCTIEQVVLSRQDSSILPARVANRIATSNHRASHIIRYTYKSWRVVVPKSLCITKSCNNSNKHLHCNKTLSCICSIYQWLMPWKRLNRLHRSSVEIPSVVVLPCIHH